MSAKKARNVPFAGPRQVGLARRAVSYGKKYLRDAKIVTLLNREEY